MSQLENTDNRFWIFFPRHLFELHSIFKAHANHAREYVQEMNADELLNEYRGIVVVSGDGLVYEIINGIMARSDDATKIISAMPIGQLPAGSGWTFMLFFINFQQIK